MLLKIIQLIFCCVVLFARSTSYDRWQKLNTLCKTTQCIHNHLEKKKYKTPYFIHVNVVLSNVVCNDICILMGLNYIT